MIFPQAELELLIEAAIYPEAIALAAIIPVSMPVGGHWNLPTDSHEDLPGAGRPDHGM